MIFFLNWEIEVVTRYWLRVRCYQKSQNGWSKNNQGTVKSHDSSACYNNDTRLDQFAMWTEPPTAGGVGVSHGLAKFPLTKPRKKINNNSRKKEKKWYNGWQLNLNLIKCYFLSVRSLNLLDKRDWLFFLNFNGKEIRLWRNNSHKRKFKVTRAKIVKNALIILFL